MFHSNLYSYKLAPSISAVTKGAGLTGDTTEGTGVDLSGYDSATLLVDLGTIAHASTTGAVKVQHSDDNVTFTDVTVADDIIGDTLTGLVVANAGTTKKVGYTGSKRYVRAYLTVTTGSSTGSFPLSCVFILGNARKNPPA